MIIRPSAQQQAVIDARRARIPEMRVVARAGSGKTTLLRMVAESDPTPGLYIAYNKAIQMDAEAKFPGHIKCRTSHSLAYRAMGMHKQRHRLEGKLLGKDVAAMFAIPALGEYRPSQWGQWVIDTVRNFTFSADQQIGPQHLAALPPYVSYAEDVLGWASRLWAEMSNQRGTVPIEHDTYLKLWQLNGARFPSDIKVAYADESQDMNAVTLDILSRQNIDRVWVGDPWQSIYAFRGAVNAMARINAPMLPLSMSYRFGKISAAIANAILSHHSEAPEEPLTGNPALDTEVGPIAAAGGPYTILSRTNAGVISAAIEGNDRIHIVGGHEPIVRLLLGGWNLHEGVPAIDVPALSRFRSYHEMVAYSEESGDAELKLLHNLIQAHGRAIPNLADSIQRRSVPGVQAADRVISTAHKAKGREWARVQLAEDFPSLEDLDARDDKTGRPHYSEEERDQELNLLYVATTRAIQRLQVNEAVKSCVHAWRAARRSGAAAG